MLLICLLMFGYSGASECDVTDKFTWDNVSYSMFFDCSLAYSDAVDECNNKGMQILRLKTTKEINYFSATVVKLGYNNKEVWVSGICPDIATSPNVDNLCAMYSANITDKETRGYVQFTSNCQDSHGWICEDKTDVHPCPSPSTPSGTTLDTLTSSHPACKEPLQTKQGVNQYLIFGTCEQPLSAAIAQCSAFNSSLAVLLSSGELQYLADHIDGQRSGSWSFWIGGLVQTGKCVKVVFDQSIIANITQRKVTVSMGHNCHDSHMFVCKTVTDLGQDNLVLHERQQGSVMDCRPTAIVLGSVGIAVLVAVVVFIVAIDVQNLVVDVGRAKRNVERFKTRWR